MVITRGIAAATIALSLAVGVMQLNLHTEGAAAKSVPPAMGATVQFEGTVYQGPDRGVVLRGPLSLKVSEPSGMVAGTLAAAKVGAVSVSGHFKNQAVNLLFTLPKGTHVFGVGDYTWDSNKHTFVIGGPLVGPRPGDSGDWAVIVPCLTKKCLPVINPCLDPNAACPAPSPQPTALPEPTVPPGPLGNDGDYYACVAAGNDPFYCIQQLHP